MARRSAAPWRRACSHCDKSFQIGLRGSGYSPEDFDWPRKQGFTVVAGRGVLVQVAGAADGGGAREDRRSRRSISPMTSTASTPPSRPAPARWRWAASRPGRRSRSSAAAAASISSAATSSRSRRRSIPSGNTALIGANFLFEMLCVLPGVSVRLKRPFMREVAHRLRDRPEARHRRACCGGASASRNARARAPRAGPRERPPPSASSREDHAIVMERDHAPPR